MVHVGLFDARPWNLAFSVEDVASGVGILDLPCSAGSCCRSSLGRILLRGISLLLLLLKLLGRML